jgi:hypothetical protein
MNDLSDADSADIPMCGKSLWFIVAHRQGG